MKHGKIWFFLGLMCGHWLVHWRRSGLHHQVTNVVRRVDTQYFPDGATSERYEFVHALYRQVLYDRLTPRRRARLHQRIGERLEALHPELTDEVVPELAHHFEAAADWPRAVEYLRLEADIARRRFAHSQADSLLQRALEVASHLPEAERAPKELARRQTASQGKPDQPLPAALR